MRIFLWLFSSSFHRCLLPITAFYMAIGDKKERSLYFASCKKKKLNIGIGNYIILI